MGNQKNPHGARMYKIDEPRLHYDKGQNVDKLVVCDG